MRKEWDNIELHERKNEARQIALEWPIRPKKNVVMLPGFKMKCVIDGIANGLFDPRSTHFHLVERDPTTMAEIRRLAKTMGIKAKLHLGELDTLKIDGKVDYAFLDFIGPVTRSIALWMRRELVPHLEAHADIAITFMYCYRNSHYAHDVDKFFSDHKEYTYQMSILTGVSNHMINIYQSMLSLIFGDFQFQFQTPIQYRDKTPMTLLRLRDLRMSIISDQDIFDKFWMFSNGQKETVRTDVISVGRLRALKAWETRRKMAERR